MMRVLVACEFSGRVREAFRQEGHEAWSCDLLPAEDGSEWHIQGDAIFAANNWDYWTFAPWDLLIAHPPCTYLSVSGLHWNKRRPERAEKTQEATEFVRTILALPITKIALENPVGCLSTVVRKPDQIIQPYEFGEDASKKTCLWLKNLPLLVPTKLIQPRMVNGKPRWSNQTDSGQNKLGPSERRWKERSRTYPGIARAMAQQWGRIG